MTRLVRALLATVTDHAAEAAIRVEEYLARVQARRAQAIAAASKPAKEKS